MTKDQFKQYISEAVDAMEQTELDYLFPSNQQPDLFTLMSEFTSLKGEIKKLAQTSLKANNDFQSAIGQNSSRWEDLQTLLQEKGTETETSVEVDEDLKKILFQLIDQNELLTDTHKHFQELGIPKWSRFKAFKKQLAAWQNGYDITMTRWRKFMKSTGLHQTGNPGQLFDPNIHEAVAVQHHPDKTNNQILETELPGYLFRNRLVRQAKVVVNKTNPEESILVMAKPGKKKKASNKKKQKRKAKRK